jgi:uncharacterized protein (TIGR02588 family)
MFDPDSKTAKSGEARRGASGSSRGRRAAEWTTLGLSIAIVALLAGYLLYNALQGDAPYVPVEVRALVERTASTAGGYILPVEVKNPGPRTLKDFQGQLTYRDPDGRQAQRTFEVEYLGEGATETRYFYFEHHPRDLRIHVQPLGYALE